MTMLIFLLYTVIFWLASSCFTRIMYFSIQQEQWLDSLFGWQKMLNRLYETEKKGIAKMLGDCQMCFAHLCSFIFFWLYVVFMNKVVSVWITDDVKGWFWVVLVNVIWYLVFMCNGTILSLIVLLFKRNSSN